jgi:class 3 adenylate cyclase/pimeloyl-ACP methyl ester carboxylesterase
VVPIPETRFAWNGDVSLAYQVVGSGPVDLVYLQGYISHVDLNWEGPALSHFLRGLANHARLIVFDRRGWGCSDRFSPFDVAPLETMTGDLACVMDAAGSERAVVFGTAECGIVTAMFAAIYPDRTRGLILCDSFAQYEESVVAGSTRAEAFEEAVSMVRDEWGRPKWVQSWTDARERDWFVRYMRSALAPGGLIAELYRYRLTDARAVFPTIHVPTLVLATFGGDDQYSAENGQYLARAIPGARLVQHDVGEGPWFHWYHRGDAIVAEVGRFLDEIGRHDAVLRRVLATVLFSDIADSTARAAELGDNRWRELVERHHAVVRSVIARFGGVEVDTAGDGFFATFDGPGRAVRAAQEVVSGVAQLGVTVRTGVHTGECEIIDGKPGGLTINVGARIAALASPSEVLVSDTVKNLVAGSGMTFEDRGTHRLKGVPDEWRIWAATT